MNIWKNKYTWSGYRGIGTSRLESLLMFKKLGGFIDNVKVSAKSKYFKGKTKTFVLNKILNMGS